jgi:hypothetical protein
MTSTIRDRNRGSLSRFDQRLARGHSGNWGMMGELIVENNVEKRTVDFKLTVPAYKRI